MAFDHSALEAIWRCYCALYIIH